MKKIVLFLTTILTASLSFGQSVTGTGTLNKIPRFLSSGVIGDSNIADSNTAVGVAAPSSITNTLTVNNTSYSSLDVNGTVSIGLGFANHIGAKIEGFKQTVNTTGLKLYTEVGFNNPFLAMTILANGNIGIGGQTSILNKFEVKVPTSTGLSGVDGIAVHDGAVNRMTVNLGINTVGEYSWIQSSKGGIGSKNLSINPYGGNVGIGTTTPVNNLGVNMPLVANSGISLQSGTFEFARFGIVNPGSNNATYIGSISNNPFSIYTNNTEKITVLANGNVGIGSMNPTSKLTVAGNINSREVKVTVDAGADFVFENNYSLPSLDAVAKYIKENKHLPEIASADEMKKEGINLSEMNIKLLQKIEEMTLYMIEQNKKIKDLESENQNFKLVFERLSKIEQKLN